MITYQLTINDDFSSILVFGSTTPNSFEGVLGTLGSNPDQVLEPEEEPTLPDVLDMVLEPTDGPTTELESFVPTKQIKLPNYNFLSGIEPVIRFSDNDMVEAFVKGNLSVLKEFSNNYFSTGEQVVSLDAEYPEPISAKANIVRNQRNTLLTESDWTQAADSPLSDDDKTAWAAYRTALRNLSDHENWPELLEEDWPTKP